MENYSYNSSYFGTHTVNIKLQHGPFKAELITQIGGNMKGAAVLASVLSSIDDNDITFEVSDENKRHLVFESSAVEGKHAYADRLKMFDGLQAKEYDISEDSTGFGKFVTGVELIDYTPESEND